MGSTGKNNIPPAAMEHLQFWLSLLIKTTYPLIPKVNQALGLPENEEILMGMDLGYPPGSA